MVVLRTHPEAEDVVDLDAGDVVGELEERDHLVLLRPPSASAPVRQPSPLLTLMEQMKVMYMSSTKWHA